MIMTQLDGRRGRTRLLLLAGLATGGASTACSETGEKILPLEATVAATDARDLSGTWILNPDQSDRPERPAGDPGIRGELRRPPGGGAGPGGRSGPDGRAGAAREFVITQTDSTVTLTDARGRALTLYPDGRDVSREIVRDGETVTVRITAEWDGDRLVVARSGGLLGGTVTESFERSPDGAQLLVDVRIQNHRLPEPMTLRRVYDKAAG